MTSSPHIPRADRAIVLCPLRFEAGSLRRALRDAACDVHCCGPGAAGVDAWAAANSDPGKDRTVILAGLAGALHDGLRIGEARVISQVRDGDGYELARPTLAINAMAATVTQSQAVIIDPTARASLAASSGADLVDLESASFVRVAQSRGWRWAIVRGVSDSVRSPLPAESATWIDAVGRTRWLAVAGALARRPGLWRDLKRLRDNSSAALKACAAQIRTAMDF